MTVGIAQVDRAEAAALEDLGALDALVAEVVAPGLQLLGATPPQREVVRRAAPTTPAGSSGYSMKPTQRARRPVERAEPHVARARVVVGRPVAHDREAEHVAVERDRALEVAGRSA